MKLDYLTRLDIELSTFLLSYQDRAIAKKKSEEALSRKKSVRKIQQKFFMISERDSNSARVNVKHNQETTCM